VKNWDSDRGFGFAKRDDCDGDIFIHTSALTGSRKSLNQGERIEFDEGVNPRNNRPCAVNVRVL
jgi:cold shock CspA family protein